MPLIAWLYWNPPQVAFTLPILDRPIYWYGILFVTGFILGYFLLNPIFRTFLNHSHRLTAIANVKQTSYFLTDRLCWFVVLGTLIGARLGHVFFYDWHYFQHHPLEILQIWRGGLASHGGTVGVLLGLYLFVLYVRRWVPTLTYLKLIDMVSIPAALVAGFIRLGNFMNQEILGTPSDLPWAVVFGHAADGSGPLPRHPVQLYEAAAYFLTFALLYQLWKRRGECLPIGTTFIISSERPAGCKEASVKDCSSAIAKAIPSSQSLTSPPFRSSGSCDEIMKVVPVGTYSGLMFICIFGSRFILEFWKDRIDASLSIPYLEIGQLLSLPLIGFGVFLIYSHRLIRHHKETSS